MRNYGISKKKLVFEIFSSSKFSLISSYVCWLFSLFRNVTLNFTSRDNALFFTIVFLRQRFLFQDIYTLSRPKQRYIFFFIITTIVCLASYFLTKNIFPQNVLVDPKKCSFDIPPRIFFGFVSKKSCFFFNKKPLFFPKLVMLTNLL